MAGTKTSAEVAASALGGTELVRGVQSAANVKITIDQIKTYIGGALGAAAATTLTIGGATLGSDVLAVTGTASISSSFSFGGNLLSTGGGGDSIYWQVGSNNGAASIVILTNKNATDFGLLKLGGATASFPAIKRSAATVAFRLADDSADAAITAAGITASGALTFSAAAAGPTLKQGANGRAGTFVLNGSTPVTVSNTSVAITDAIIISLNAVGGTVGVHPTIATITAATGFTVAGTALDTSTYNYAIIKNAA